MHIAIDAINSNAYVRGPDRYLIGLLHGLAQHGDDTRYTIFYAPWQQHYQRLELPSRFQLICCAAPRNQWARVLWHATVFPRIARRAEPDLIHLPNLIYTWRLGIPMVMTVHDLAHYRYPEKFGRVRGHLLRWLLHHTLASADLAIAVSRHTREDILNFMDYPRRRIRVILEGSPQNIGPTVPPTTPARSYFLCVAQLERTKNIERLIRAFADSTLFKEQRVELRIAGPTGNAAKNIRALLVQCNSDNRIKMLGYVDEKQLRDLYVGCQAFVFPSLVEGFGLVLLEAMSHGAPVIASNASVMPEIVGNAALLVDPLDTGAIRAAMERVYREPALRAALIALGFERLKAFSWHQAADQTWQVYQELLALDGDDALSPSGAARKQKSESYSANILSFE